MRSTIRLAAIAMAVPASFLFATTPSAAACSTPGPACLDHIVNPDPIIGTGPGTGGGSGVTCTYIKLFAPPPSDYPAEKRDDSPPYLFTRSQAWGDDHEGEYDWQGCILPCTVFNPPPIVDFLSCNAGG